MDRLASRFAIALRAGSVATSAVAGPIAATDGVSDGLLALVLITLACWAAFFVRAVLRNGLTRGIVVVDAVLVGATLLLQGELVPDRSVADGTTWVLMLASTAVFIPQLCFRPAVALLTSGLIAAAYVAGAPVATDVSFLIIQAVVTSILMTLLRRGGRRAGGAVSRAFQSRRTAMAQAARRADEREQFRRLHDTVLSTLTMVASGAFDRPSVALSAKASEDLAVLGALRTTADAGEPGTASLAKRLQEVVDGTVGLLTVDLSVTTPPLPADVVERLGACVGEALRNVALHSGVRQATVSATHDASGLVIEVADEGRGFEPARVPLSRRGIRESIRGRARTVGATAEVISSPGHGTRVVLRWSDE